jgi:MSHA biogenesis protein MshE
MGAEGFLIASALSGIVAQRLMRRVCDSCSEPAEPTQQQRVWLSAYMDAGEDASGFVRGAGCTYCNMTGYRGRIGIYELLEIDGPIADAIRRDDLARVALLARRQPAFVPLVRHALSYAHSGVTSVEEVIRVTAGLDEQNTADTLVDEILASETPQQGIA